MRLEVCIVISFKTVVFGMWRRRFGYISPSVFEETAAANFSLQHFMKTDWTDSLSINWRDWLTEGLRELKGNYEKYVKSTLETQMYRE